jgi:hypothetical protein
MQRVSRQDITGSTKHATSTSMLARDSCKDFFLKLIRYEDEVPPYPGPFIQQACPA